MLRGKSIGLRARRESDVRVLHTELYDNVVTRSRADSRPWRPIPPGSAASPYAVAEPSDDAACFSVVDLADDELAGEALLWASTCTIESRTSASHCARAFAAEVWPPMSSGCSAAMASPCVACIGCRSRRLPITHR